VEADKQLLSTPNRWGAKIAGWTQQCAGKFVVRWGVFLHVKKADLFSFGGPDLADRMSQFERLVASQSFFTRIDLFDNGRVGIRKNLLRFGTAPSAIAVVIPVNFGCHLCSFLSESGCGMRRDV
jgi:hypothetical protein